MPKKKSGFSLLMEILPHMKKEFSVIEFDRDDIVRSEFVRSWIVALEDHSNFYGEKVC